MSAPRARRSSYLAVTAWFVGATERILIKPSTPYPSLLSRHRPERQGRLSRRVSFGRVMVWWCVLDSPAAPVASTRRVTVSVRAPDTGDGLCKPDPPPCMIARIQDKHVHANGALPDRDELCSLNEPCTILLRIFLNMTCDRTDHGHV